MIEISVCICTFQRPDRLLQLLRSLQRLDRATPPYEIIVVDNDAGRTAEPAVCQVRGEGLNVYYAVEPQRGIARARNRSVALACGEYVAFIDDDEEADPQWLLQLWTEVRRYGVDGGIGPVIPKFRDGTPRWLIEGRFFERPRFPTGTILDAKLTRTGNAFVRRQPLMALAGPFDEQYDLTGGEDTDLFIRMIGAGSRFVAVDSAIVHEHLSPARTSVGWLLQRRFLAGLGGARFDYGAASARARRWQGVRHFGLACKWGALGILALPAYWIYAVDRLLLAARMLGCCAFLAGFSYRPYMKDSWR